MASYVALSKQGGILELSSLALSKQGGILELSSQSESFQMSLYHKPLSLL
jgi:hypothetical protein